MPSPAILIVGAGPTGLVLALTLAKKGVPFRIIDNDTGPGSYSRAVVVHARPLEFYRQLGFADEIIARGVPMSRIKFRARHRAFVEIQLADMGRGLSPYAMSLGLPQDEHEALLADHLRKLGVEVDWGVTLKDLKAQTDGAEVTLLRGSTEERARFSYVCGADGASSLVRKLLGVAFSGGTYNDIFYVADAEVSDSTKGDMAVYLGKQTLALTMQIRSNGMHRIVGLVPHRLLDRKDLTFDDIRADVEPLLDIKVQRINWFSTYRVHHRVADKFRVGRCFLLGDAGHAHSPAGGQGMNTGIGDAFNLGWKLAEVVQGRAPEKILESYEIERIAFARTLVDTTDRAFEVMTGAGWVNSFLRVWILPGLLSRATRFSRVRKMIFKVISQTRITYRQSFLSEGRAGKVFGGDRLPWVTYDAGDNFEPLKKLEWQVHVYGDVVPGFRDFAAKLNLPIHAFAFSDMAAAAGLARDAAYLIRPDGHVGLAMAAQDGAHLGHYVAGVMMVDKQL